MNITEEGEMPSLDINQLGVEQPVLATKDIVIIVFMFLLWAYSLYLTYRAWYKILYSDGEEGSNMWRSDNFVRLFPQWQTIIFYH